LGYSVVVDLLTRLGVDAATIAAFCARRKIVRMEIFGSAARGQLRPESDVDVMLTFAPEAPWSLYDLVDMQDELAGFFQRDVDIVEAGSVRNPYRARSIEHDLQLVYAA
jgi:predicted nucleotidyltransferase